MNGGISVLLLNGIAIGSYPILFCVVLIIKFRIFMTMYRFVIFAFVFLLFGCEIDQPSASSKKEVPLSKTDINSSFTTPSNAGSKIDNEDDISKKIDSQNENRASSEAQFGEIEKIQANLLKANPDYRKQGNIHEKDGRIFAAEFPNCGLKDLSPLRGLELNALDLSGNPVREIRHLRGMPLERLFLEYTSVESLTELKDAKLIELRLNGSPVRSLKGLEGQPIENLYAVNTQINDISSLAKSNLRQLWLTESPVSNLKPLEGLPLVSLTLHRTLVEDLSFVRKLPVIQRLHIGETLITDLTPLKGVNLTRLVFSPERIKRGLDVVKRLSNLREIGTKFDDTGRDLTSPKNFWLKF